MTEYVYTLYHYRGPVVSVHDTPLDAQEAKESQKEPSEFYWEMTARVPSVFLAQG